jgi:NADH-quinone oxidoreductase subunit A
MDLFTPNILSLAMLFGIALALVVVMFLAAVLLGPKKFNRAKVQPFECGMSSESSPREGGIRMRFYLVAILFVVFDIEAIFLYPWAVSYQKLGMFGFVEAMIFIGALIIGLVYVWRKGVFEWK